MTDRAAILQAILPQVPFDGWSDAAFAAACADLGISIAQGRAVVPRGAVDLAADHHKAGDAAMVAAVRAADMAGLKFRDKVALALRLRLRGLDREEVRRASALFALPYHAPEGARLIWGTADAVWTALGDTSVDLNWYTKRATLAAVWGAVVLYWLGDDSADGQATDAFIDRRIGDVMQIERWKAQANAAPVLRPLTAILSRLSAGIRAPGQTGSQHGGRAAGRAGGRDGGRSDDLPGYWSNPPAGPQE